MDKYEIKRAEKLAKVKPLSKREKRMVEVNKAIVKATKPKKKK